MLSMLWLAGLMGLVAVGAAAFVDPVGTHEDDDDDASMPADELVADTLAFADDGDDPFGLDSPRDPRGGDDASDLPPLVLDPAQMIQTIEGTGAEDDIFGDDGNDRIFAGESADDVSGGSGNDELRGEDGEDVLRGDGGDDTLHGDGGADTLFGGLSDDSLVGHNDDDLLWGEDGDDALMGSAGDDTLNGDAGDDVLHGGLGDDSLDGGIGSDTLFGGWGNDMLNGVLRGIDFGGSGMQDVDQQDFLNGGDGDDSIIAGAGDIVTAGTGADQIMLGDWITGGDAAEIIDFTPEEDSLLLVWDDGADAQEPQIDIAEDPDMAGRSIILMDGAVVASVNGNDLTADDMALVPLSVASAMGFAPGI